MYVFQIRRNEWVQINVDFWSLVAIHAFAHTLIGPLTPAAGGKGMGEAALYAYLPVLPVCRYNAGSQGGKERVVGR